MSEPAADRIRTLLLRADDTPGHHAPGGHGGARPRRARPSDVDPLEEIADGPAAA